MPNVPHFDRHPHPKSTKHRGTVGLSSVWVIDLLQQASEPVNIHDETIFNEINWSQTLHPKWNNYIQSIYLISSRFTNTHIKKDRILTPRAWSDDGLQCAIEDDTGFKVKDYSSQAQVWISSPKNYIIFGSNMVPHGTMFNLSVSLWPNWYKVDASRMPRGPIRAPERYCVPISLGTPSTAKSAEDGVSWDQSAKGGYLRRIRNTKATKMVPSQTESYIIVHSLKKVIKSKSIKIMFHCSECWWTLQELCTE